jgi:hypothetical protein
VLFCQAVWLYTGAFLDGYFTYFSHGVRYNGSADEERPSRRVMNDESPSGAIEPRNSSEDPKSPLLLRSEKDIGGRIDV